MCIRDSPDTDRFLHAVIGGKEIDWKQSRDSTLNVLINGPTSNGFGKDIFRTMARDLYGRLKAHEDTGLEPEEVTALGTVSYTHLYPKIKAAYIRAFGRMLNERKKRKPSTDWQTGEDVMHWWMEEMCIRDR